MTRYLMALTLAACAPAELADDGPCDPPRQTRAVRLDAAGSGLDAELEEVAAYYRALGYAVEVGAGADTVPIEWVHTPHLGLWNGTRIALSLDHEFAFGDEDECSAPYAVEVLRHEVGHAMGFPHVADAGDVMAPALGPCDHRARLCASSTTEPALLADDGAALRGLVR